MMTFLVLLGVLAIGGSVIAALAWSAGGTQPSGERLTRIKASPQWADGKFKNPIPEVTNLWGAMKQMFGGGGEYQIPRQPLPMAHPTDLSTPPQSGLRITKAASAPVYVPKPGESFEPASLPLLERWWPDRPWQTAAEHPIVSSGL